MIATPSTLECLSHVYEDNLRLDLDLEIANFLTENFYLISGDRFYEDIPEGFYNTWASLIVQTHQENLSMSLFEALVPTRKNRNRTVVLFSWC
jgi:hypothetical protein